MSRSDAAVYLECEPASPSFPAVVHEARRLGVRMKLRTGGMSADAFPTSHALAAAIQECVCSGVPFKCTAGLHHAVRHRDAATGFEHHGFLNVLLAAADNLPTDAVAALETTDPATLVALLSTLDAEGVVLARSRFVSFGTCSIAEPVADLVALGLLNSRLEVAA